MTRRTPITSWNGPHSGVVPVLPHVALDYGDKARPVAQKGKPAPFAWDWFHWRFKDGEREITAAEFVRLAHARGAFDIRNLWHWATWWDKQMFGRDCPRDLDGGAMARMATLLDDLRGVLDMTDAVGVLDIESGDIAAKVHLTAALLGRAPLINYGSTSQLEPVPGMIHTPGAGGDWTCLNLYDHPKVMTDVRGTLAAVKGPLVVAVSTKQTTPAMLAEVRRWKDAGGDLRHVIIWNHSGGIDAAADRAIVEAINGVKRVQVKPARVQKGKVRK